MMDDVTIPIHSRYGASPRVLKQTSRRCITITRPFSSKFSSSFHWPFSRPKFRLASFVGLHTKKKVLFVEDQIFGEILIQYCGCGTGHRGTLDILEIIWKMESACWLEMKSTTS
ncbi:uncharacterized protein BDCG_16185 [Blastomyces dermatitidis ER-3]|uniref:Uncharacterized protein n=1 Tax=Ajellomyces dermatitidis (strain ER-3 / ATCC MYA-2586) TaxID=559297 RepID=A0ABX2VQL5_AJEDR|nr:uncharacterized protein BDCG_16185 [Blastomyces dermatitidis ER-3]OAS99538.1 hypothetical protein BDCG_16185 [Blastomyces dermatitidis ER-3]